MRLQELEGVSRTALMVSAFLQHSGIPYARELADLIQAESETRADWGALYDEVFPSASLSVSLRHLAMTSALMRSKLTRVLELGAGFTPRGLELSRRPHFEIIESDLAPVVELKRRVAAHFVADRQNYHCTVTDATNPDEIQRAARLQGKQPLAILFAGMLGYLSRSNQDRCLGGVTRELILRPGSICLATSEDFLTKAEIERYYLSNDLGQKIIEKLTSISGVNLYDLAFDADQDRTDFIMSHGLVITRVRELDLVPTFSRSLSGEMRKRLLHREIWQLQLP